MPKIIKCVVDTCYNFNTVNINNNENSSETISFFRFPKNPELKKQWLKILSKTKAKCTQRICSSHFEEKFICLRGICKCLSENAVPTIFASSSTASDHREPLVELDSNMLNLAEFNEENLNAKLAVEDKLSSHGSSTDSLFKIHDSDHEECADATKIIMASGSKSDEESLIMEDMNKAYVRDRKRHKQLKPLKKISLKRALKTSTSCESSSPTKTKRRKLKLKILRSSYRALKKKQHCLDQKIIRQNRKIENLGNVLKEARDQNLLQEENLVNLLSMSESIKEILRRQLRKSKGLALPKVYPAEIRTFAMNLNFYSPKGYEYVRKMFDLLLPHSKTISEWYKCVNGKAGFTEESFHTLRLLANNDRANNRTVFCNVVFDEINIRSQVEWNGTRSVGCVDLGNGDESDEVATQILVFMAVGVNKRWKLPLGYFPIASLNSQQKHNLLNMCLDNLFATGVRIIGVTFDGCPTNFSVGNLLGCKANVAKHSEFESLDPSFTFEVKSVTEKLIILPDPCHMLKLIRNTIAEKGL